MSCSDHIRSGVIATTVVPLGAAAKGGMLVDDVILEIAGHKIGNDGTVCNALKHYSLCLILFYR